MTSLDLLPAVESGECPVGVLADALEEEGNPLAAWVRGLRVNGTTTGTWWVLDESDEFVWVPIGASRKFYVLFHPTRGEATRCLGVMAAARCRGEA